MTMHERKKPAVAVNLGWRVQAGLWSVPKITERAKRLMAGPVGGAGADDDMVAQFDFQKLAGAD